MEYSENGTIDMIERDENFLSFVQFSRLLIANNLSAPRFLMINDESAIVLTLYDRVEVNDWKLS